MGAILFIAPIFYSISKYQILYLKETDIIFQAIGLTM